MLYPKIGIRPVIDGRWGGVFRPHAWSGFGTEDAESADYRACAAYGPLYQ